MKNENTKLVYCLRPYRSIPKSKQELRKNFLIGPFIMRTKSKPTRRTQASFEAITGSDSTGLLSFYSNSVAYQSAVGGTQESPLSHCDFVSFLANAQCEGVDILPITWQPALENVGKGGTAQINQSIINARLNFIFKRTNISPLIRQDSGTDSLTYHALISELRVLRSRLIRDHPNIVQLQGICWEVISDPQTVRPVLVFEKAHFGDMKAFMESNLGESLSLEERIQLIVALASALLLMHSRGERGSPPINEYGNLHGYRRYSRRYQASQCSYVPRLYWQDCSEDGRLWLFDHRTSE